MPDDELMPIAEAAAYLKRPVRTLYDWRHRNVGPRSARMRGRVVYRRSDLDKWLDAQFEATAAGDGAA